MEYVYVGSNTSGRKTGAWSESPVNLQSLFVENEPSSQESNLYKCEKCNKVYQLQTSLRRHMRVECGKEPKHACPNCGRKFKHRFNLLEHLRHLACKSSMTQLS